MIHIGYVPVSGIAYIPFSTNDSNGAAITFTGTVSNAKVYKNASTVERASAAGMTLSKDFDSVTGSHLLSLDLSDNTDAGFWADGSMYSVMLSAITVDTRTVTVWIGAFRIGVAAANVTQLAATAQTAGDIIPAISGIGTAGGAAINQDCYTDDYVAGTLSAADGVLVGGTLTPSVSPGWTINQLIGKGIRLGATNWYLVSANTATAATIVSPPGNATYAYLVGGIFGVTQAVTKVGTETGTFANTSNVNAAYQIMAHAGQAVDLVYQFLTGGGTSPVQCTWTGYYQPNGGILTFAAWRFDTGAWENLITLAGAGGTTNVVKNITLYARHAGTVAAELGKVYIRLYSNGDAHNHIVATDQIIVSYSVTSRTVGYSDGAVWYDNLHGTAGTVSYVNGTADKPVTLIADVLTLCTNIGLRRIHVSPLSSITFTAPVVGYEIIGEAWTLALGAQNITDTTISGASVSGTGTGLGAEFYDCDIAACTLSDCDMHACGFSSTLTLGNAGAYLFHNCYSSTVAGASAVLDFVSATGATTVRMPQWYGNLQINNMKSGDVLVIGGMGRLTLDASCTAGTVYVRGNFEFINSGSGQTIVDTSRYGEDQNVTGVTGTLSDARIANLDAAVTTRLAPTVAARTLDVSTTGEAGVDLDNIKDATGAHTLTNITVPTVTAVTNSVNLVTGQLQFKKNIAHPNFAFPMFDAAGQFKTGLTVTASIRKDAANSFTALAGSVTEIGATGWYTVDFAQAETNANDIAFQATASGALPTALTIVTQA